MIWVHRLLRRLTSAWSRDPLATPAFSVVCDGTNLVCQVADGVLTLTPTGGTAQPFTVQLSTLVNLDGLAYLIHNQQGYSIRYSVGAPIELLSPLALVEGTSSEPGPTQQLNVAQSLHYLILQAIGAELATAEAQIPLMPLQMSTTTASGSWLDFLGTFYAVPRLPLEGDAAYAIRIIQETVRPKVNNVSMARAIQSYTGLSAQVTDVTNYSAGTNLFNGAFTFNGSKTFTSGYTTETGGLFDVEAGYDLIDGTEITAYEPVILGYINRLRAAGTQLRNLVLAPLSSLADTANVPDDGGDTLTVTYTQTFNGSFTFNGQAQFTGGLTFTGNIEGQGTFAQS